MLSSSHLIRTKVFFLQRFQHFFLLYIRGTLPAEILQNLKKISMRKNRLISPPTKWKGKHFFNFQGAHICTYVTVVIFTLQLHWVDFVYPHWCGTVLLLYYNKARPHLGWGHSPCDWWVMFTHCLSDEPPLLCPSLNSSSSLHPSL